MRRLSRPCMSVLLWVLVLGVVTRAPAKAPPPAGTLTIATTSVAVGLGVNWGTGVLTTRGQRYPFALQGLEVGGVGVAKVQATGQVYHLGRVADFAGTYVAVGAGAAVGEGAGLLTLRNPLGGGLNFPPRRRG